MPRVDIHMSSKISPERIRSALVDFSPDRPKTWPGITPELYEVYETAESWAEVKEESNFCAPGSYVEAMIKADSSGGSTIDVTWNRQPTTLMARVMAAFIVGTRGMPVSRSMKAGLANIEAG